ncbi:hypothetical protein QYE76_002592 [Lolium multiflorum]|uniref:Transposase (putative) gypsy type domain-containing protein n=1 Tax=Lolium multiflorum TaxID=4521 RepID=A0AAD8VYF0_LOLMU|nr:hypothetical protein QYE76_002592 [Lolium multiflorum]
MGKKKMTASSGATASTARVKAPSASRKAGAATNLDWTTSSISKRDENKLRTMWLISSDESYFLHPGSISRPKPPKGFTIMFSAFLHRGLSLPAHEFLSILLFSYGIQLWQLTPNSILHITIFFTVFEAFLGIDPHWGLWRKIVYVKCHSGGKASAPPAPKRSSGFFADEDDLMSNSEHSALRSCQVFDWLVAEAQKENASLKEELKQLKKKMNEEEQSKLKAQAQAYKKEGALRNSIESLLGTADMHVDRTNKLRVDSMSDALSFAVESSEQI